jgi:hypothetical protein
MGIDDIYCEGCKSFTLAVKVNDEWKCVNCDCEIDLEADDE